MPEAYIDVMLQSLKKKEQILEQIISLDDRQKKQLEDSRCTADEFDATVEEKAGLIEQLEQLDDGFEKMYERMKGELQENRTAYADQIQEMQELIRSITDKSVQIQAQEARNKDLMVQKFARVKRQAKEIRSNNKATTEYYRSMSQVNYIDPQFMDNKK